MEFLAEFLFELLGEAFLENGLETAADHRLPQWLRVLILTVTALVFVFVFGLILLVGIGALSHTPLISLICFVLDAGLVFLLVPQVRSFLRTRK